MMVVSLASKTYNLFLCMSLSKWQSQFIFIFINEEDPYQWLWPPHKPMWNCKWFMSALEKGVHPMIFPSIYKQHIIIIFHTKSIYYIVLPWS